MNKHSRETLDAYYAEAASWNRDRVQSVQTSNRIAWLIAGAAAIVAILEAIALVLLTPLKTVEPYTLLVDRTTGYVQALKPLDQAKIAPDSALTQSFLVQYVVGRETFDMATLNANYRKTALFSADAARTSYLQTMQVSNPDSPLVRYPRTTTIDVRVKSISTLGPNAALVRFDTIRSDANGATQPPSPWVAVIRYRYSTAPMSVEDRYVNPLGFQVTSYRKDPEALPPAADQTSGALPASADRSAVVSAAPPAPIQPYYNGVQSPAQLRAKR
jgi:type IV secretion system protein VirB8